MKRLTYIVGSEVIIALLTNKEAFEMLEQVNKGDQLILLARLDLIIDRFSIKTIEPAPPEYFIPLKKINEGDIVFYLNQKPLSEETDISITLREEGTYHIIDHKRSRLLSYMKDGVHTADFYLEQIKSLKAMGFIQDKEAIYNQKNEEAKIKYQNQKREALENKPAKLEITN